MNIEGRMLGLTKGNKIASGQIQWKALEESGKHLDKHITAYWLIGGYSLRDGCKIDQMEGYPYSPRQAVCQYPSLETENGWKDPWHSPAVQRLVTESLRVKNGSFRIHVKWKSVQSPLWRRNRDPALLGQQRLAEQFQSESNKSFFFFP